MYVSRDIRRWCQSRGATTAEKLRGPGFGSQHRGACLGVGCGRGSPPPAVMVRGITQKIFDNSDAKSCILVTNVFGF